MRFWGDCIEVDRIVCSDSLEFLKSLPDECVNLCVTSPPYYGLRDYGVDGQIGLEPDFRDYVKKLVELFHELKRVLKGDGSFYLNLGDSYSSSGGAGGQYEKWHSLNRLDGFKKFGGHKDRVISVKCLLGLPWRVALSLIDDGWILRNCIIWHKPNAMPCSVKDRLTNTYEFVFHFVKSKKYYYNLDAIRVPHKSVTVERMKRYLENKEHYDPKRHKTDPSGLHQPSMQVLENSAKRGLNPLGKNPGDVVAAKYSRADEKGVDPRYRAGSGPMSWKAWKEVHPHTTHPLGKNPGDVYLGKLVENSEQYASPRARRTREEFQNRDYHPKGKNPGDTLTTVHDFTRPKADGVMKTRGMVPPPNVHKQNPDRVWNPKGKNLGDSLSIDGVSFTRKVGRITKHEVEKAKSQPSKRILRWMYKPNPLGYNPGDFWIINTRGFKGAHFAVYPEELLRRPILSSSRIGDIVFDPFIGSGTTAVVAKKAGRHFLGCDLNPEYVKIAEDRLRCVLS